MKLKKNNEEIQDTEGAGANADKGNILAFRLT